MEVLSVTRQRGRVVITLSGEVLRIPAALYLQRPLQPGDEVDLEEYDHWLLLQQYRPALEYAVSLLAQRPYAEQELNQKLARYGYRPAVCEMVLYKLSKHGLLDDRAFAQQWTEARAGRGLGRTRIAQELRRKASPRRRQRPRWRRSIPSSSWRRRSGWPANSCSGGRPTRIRAKPTSVCWPCLCEGAFLSGTRARRSAPRVKS